MKTIIKRIAYSLIGATFFTSIYLFNLLLAPENLVNDLIYQRPQTPDERIVIFGVDSRALNEFGSWPWDRSLIADAINYLNQDPQNKPAVIGIDVIYDVIDNPESDALLIEAAKNSDNLVMSNYATFDNSIIDLGADNFYVDTVSATSIVQPYEELREVTMQGHVNAMLDLDGILRHAIWEIETTDNQVIPSFNQVIAQKYADTMGLAQIEPPPADSKGRWYVVQQSPPGGYSEGFSVADLVNGEVDPQYFADKIVLIGPYDTSFKDEYITAIDHAKYMAGIEYQANAIGALLAGDMKQENTTLSAILLFTITFFTFITLPYLNFAFSTISTVLAIIGWGFFCILAFDNGLILPIIHQIIALITAYSFTLVNSYYSESRKRKKIYDTFNRYVAPEIVKELLEGDPKNLELGGKMVNIAVLFVDIRGFTSLCEKLHPATIVNILNNILSLTTKCIKNNQGTLDKYIGDCTMAFWGAPLSQPDCAYKAVKTALEMSEGIIPLAQEIENQFGHKVGFGIGINYGNAIVGNIGAPSLMDYTIIGDVVNTASRLEGSAPPGAIHVSKSVADELAGRINFTSLGTEIKLKDKEDFEIFKIDGFAE